MGLIPVGNTETIIRVDGEDVHTNPEQSTDTVYDVSLSETQEADELEFKVPFKNQSAPQPSSLGAVPSFIRRFHAPVSTQYSYQFTFLNPEGSGSWNINFEVIIQILGETAMGNRERRTIENGMTDRLDDGETYTFSGTEYLPEGAHDLYVGVDASNIELTSNSQIHTNYTPTTEPPSVEDVTEHSQ